MSPRAANAKDPEPGATVCRGITVIWGPSRIGVIVEPFIVVILVVLIFDGYGSCEVEKYS